MVSKTCGEYQTLSKEQHVGEDELKRFFPLYFKDDFTKLLLWR